MTEKNNEPKEIVRKDSSNLSKSTVQAETNDFIKRLQEAEKVAEYIANSSTFGANFIEIIKDSEGNILEKKVNKNK